MKNKWTCPICQTILVKGETNDGEGVKKCPKCQASWFLVLCRRPSKEWLDQLTENSEALLGPKDKAISQLRKVALECSEDDWDGYDARPANSNAVHHAEDFILAMPENLPMPECAVEPDGSISLDWITPNRVMFSISVSCNGGLAYAWNNESEKDHAVEHFDGMTIPPRLLSDMNRILCR